MKEKVLSKPLAGASWRAEYTGLANEIRVRHYSPKTLKTYKQWSRQFQTYTRSKPPALLSTADVNEFLTSLAVKRQVSASTQNQAFNALLFFFRHVLHKEFCLKTYFFFEMMTYLLVTPIIFLFCMADTTFALKRSEESGA